jgi:hypothetical protein
MANGLGAALGGAGIGGLLGFTGSLISGFQAKKAQTRFRRRQRRAIEEARQFADETVSRITDSPLFSQAQDFLTGTFGAAADSPLVQDIGKQIRAAQSARGLFFGNAAASAEALGTGVAAQRLRQSLLSSVAQFATLPEQVRQSTLNTEAALRTAAATGAAFGGLQPQQFIDPIGQALSSGIQGAAGGFQLGQEFGARQNEAQLEDLLPRRTRLNTRFDLTENELRLRALTRPGAGINF